MDAAAANMGGLDLTAGAKSVYMGSYQTLVAGQPGSLKEVRRGKAPIWVTKQEAVEDFNKWTDKQRRDFLSMGVVGGLLKLGDGVMEARKLWGNLVDEAATDGKAGRKTMPWDVLASYVREAGGTGGRWVKQGDFEVNTVTGERRYIGPRFKTQADTRTDLTDPDTARAIATKLFQDMMGRDPGRGELGAFATALHQAEESNPVTQVTTTEYNMKTGEAIGSKTNSSGGMTAEGRGLIGESQIKRDPEYGAFQAATTYQNVLENLVNGAG
jgi:hypothetical protein